MKKLKNFLIRIGIYTAVIAIIFTKVGWKWCRKYYGHTVTVVIHDTTTTHRIITKLDTLWMPGQIDTIIKHDVVRSWYPNPWGISDVLYKDKRLSFWYFRQVLGEDLLLEEEGIENFKDSYGFHIAATEDSLDPWAIWEIPRPSQPKKDRLPWLRLSLDGGLDCINIMAIDNISFIDKENWYKRWVIGANAEIWRLNGFIDIRPQGTVVGGKFRFWSNY